MKKTNEISKKLFIEEFEQPASAWLGYRLTTYTLGEEGGLPLGTLTGKIGSKG